MLIVDKKDALDIESGILPVARGGTGVNTSTGTGNAVLSNSPTLVTPNIGAATGSISGNAGTSTKLAATKTIGMTGDVSWTSGAFDGSDNVTGTSTLATITDSGTGTFKKITTDTKGRVTGTQAVAQADITGLLGAGSITNTMISNTAVANLSGTNTGDQTITLTGDVTGSGTGSFATTLANSGVTAGTYSKVTVDGKGRVTAGLTPTMEDIPDATFKRSVRAATTANITLSAPQTIDGISLVAGDRVLVKDQTTTSQNGIYVVAAGAWTRALDANTSSKIASALVAVDSGTANGGKLFDNDFKTTDTLGTTEMLWSSNLDSGHLLASTSASIGAVAYNGTTAAVGKFDGGSTTPTGTSRLNYGGYFYPTYINLSASADTATAATNYYVETGSDGFIRPKTLANTIAEIGGQGYIYKNSAVFNASGSWTCPAGVTRVMLVGAGGGGGGEGAMASPASSAWQGGSGGGGSGAIVHSVTVVPGTAYTVTIGAGGAASVARTDATISSTGGNGGTSVFGTVNFYGGKGGSSSIWNSGRGSGIGGGGGYVPYGSGLGFGNIASYLTNGFAGCPSGQYTGGTALLTDPTSGGGVGSINVGCGGGAGIFGNGGNAVNYAAGAAAAANTGAGGAGGMLTAASAATAGGAGGSGKIIVYW